MNIRQALRIFCVLLLLALALVLWANLLVVGVTRQHIFTDTSKVPAHDAVLLLGASIKQSGELSPVLQERADAAIALYEAGKADKILVSGDNSTPQYNEVYPVGKYLLKHGIPQGDIFLDYAGFDTYSSMYRAKEVFGVTSMVVASQGFHLPRALFIARMFGIDAVGFDVAKPGDNFTENTLREIPATTKALWDLMRKRKPQYLGQQFFISGDSAATWIGNKAPMIYFKDGAR